MSSIYFLLLLVFVSAHSSPIERKIELKNTRVDDALYRIPSGAVRVEHYDIELRLGKDLFETLQFEGTVEIKFTNLEFENEIKLHANKMEFKEISLKDDAGTEVELTHIEFAINTTNEFLTLTTAESLQKNASYVLRIDYSTELRTSLNGFYLSSYQNSDGETVYLGTTQFQTTSARKAFPCFDEPSYKAVFDIRIRYPKSYETGGEYNAIGNTPEITVDDETDPDFKITTFATTPRMSTYLIAFVVSDFTCSDSEQPIDVDIPHSVCSRSDTAGIRNLALEAGPKIANALEDYTGVKYNTSTIGKIHQAAIPDFSAGAMENWGLVTYREYYILWDPEVSTNANKKSVLTIISHELGHFWFGNLVTCHWWSDTFLNEGFATYFEYFGVNEVYPEMEFDKRFIIDELWPVLISDAASNAAPLSSPAASPDEVSGRFSTISYSKGGSIFRMVRHFLGLDNFKQGLNKYLTDNAFQAVTPEHLWSALDNFAPEDLPESVPILMQNWVEKSGFPVITVSVEGRDVILSQKRYLSNPSDSDDTTWWVPISYTTSSDSNKFEDTSARFWLTPSSDNQTISNALQNENDWIIVNNQQAGYFRIDYSDELWQRIKDALKQQNFSNIHELNRAQIVDDFYNFARYGYRSYADLLSVYEFLKSDTSYYPWYTAFTTFTAMTGKVGNLELKEQLQKYISDSLKNLYFSVPFSEDNDDDQIYTMTKVLVIPWACRLGLEDCAVNAYSAFVKYRDENIKPNKNLVSTVYCNGIRHSTDVENDWNFMWNLYLNDSLASDKSTFLTSLGCVTNKEIAMAFLNKTITADSGISSSDVTSVFSTVYTNNPTGVDIALDFVIENFNEMVDALSSSNAVTTILNNLGSRLTRQEQITKLEEFINDNDLGSHETVANNALNTAKTNLKSIMEFENDINSYFNPEPTTVSSTSTSTPSSTLSSTLSSTPSSTPSSTSESTSESTPGSTTTLSPSSTTESNSDTISANFAIIVISLCFFLYELN